MNNTEILLYPRPHPLSRASLSIRSYGLQQTRIMVVEDEGLIADHLAQSLLKLGYRTTSIVSSVAKALERIPKDSPDLVLMDITLGPGQLDGIEGARQIRSSFDLPVIFLTAHSDAHTLDRAKRAEPFGYLVKPVRGANLTSSIETGLYKHRVDKLLREREGWLTTILESLPHATILTDLEGTIRFVNPAATTLLDDDVSILMGQRFRAAVTLLDAQTSEFAGDLVDAAILLRQTLRFPHGLVLRTRLGDTSVAGEVTPTFIGDTVAGAVITLRNGAEDDKAALDRYQENTMIAIGRMAAGIAATLGYVPKQNSSRPEHLRDVISESQALPATRELCEVVAYSSEISSQLLALSSTRNMHPEIVDVNENVRRVVGMMEGRVPAAVTIELNLTETLLDVRATAIEIDQVLLTLIDRALNSIQYAGTIVISTSLCERNVLRGTWGVTEQFVQLTITDSGIEVPSEAQEHIFEPFSMPGTSSRAAFGLAIAHTIVRDVGGEISFKSGKQCGNAFVILLPRDEQRASTTLAQPGKCILLVHHDPTIRNLLHNQLEKHGYRVLPAERAAEAMTVADLYEGMIDVLVLGTLLPGLASSLRQVLPAVRTLFLSRHLGDELNRFDTTPQDLTLRGPFSLEDVLRGVNQLTRQGEDDLRDDPTG